MFTKRTGPTSPSGPTCCASWLWNGFDFATTIRREGDADDINTKGLVTYDRKISKDAYFFYSANWNPAPTVHITGRATSTGTTSSRMSACTATRPRRS